jgi:DNA/RNA endonuclease YhcR with UshA esterase domain
VVDAAARRRAVITGTIVAVEVRHCRRAPACTARIDDGTGQLILVFTGARRVPGLVEGTKVTVEGTVLDEEEGLAVWNPFYRFEP